MYCPAPRPLMLVSPPGVAASYRLTCLRLRRSARSLDFYKRVTQLHRERTEQVAARSPALPACFNAAAAPTPAASAPMPISFRLLEQASHRSNEIWTLASKPNGRENIGLITRPICQTREIG
jgi:hypothetical protein